MPDLPWLTILMALPALGALALSQVPAARVSLIRLIAASITLATLLITAGLFFSYDPGGATAQFVERHAWVPTLGIHYHLALDGMSVTLVVLTAFIAWIAVVSSFRNVEAHDKQFHMAILAFECTALGVFMARDLALFFVFWEASLLPLFLMVGWWGLADRIAAATRFLVFSAVGSATLLVGILLAVTNAYRLNGALTFDLAELSRVGVSEPLGIAMLLTLVAGFAVRLPLFPLHGWAPETQAQGPAAASVLLAGVSLPMAVYGLARVAIPLAPEIALDHGIWIAAFGAIGLVYGACLGMAQHDMRKRLTYVAMSQAGLILIGLFALDARAIEGAMMLAIHLGLALATMHVVLAILEEITGAHSMFDVGGIARRMPIFAALFGAAVVMLIGIPGSAGFVGEVLLFQGLIARHPLWALIGAAATIFIAVYMLILLRRILLGTPQHDDTVRDVTLRERVIVATMLLLGLALGFQPRPVQRAIEPTAKTIADTVTQIRFDRIDEANAIRMKEQR